MTMYPTNVTKKIVTRNCLTFMEKHTLLKWMTKHLDFCKSKGMTGAETVAKAAKEMDFPVTVLNAKNLWVKEAGRTWPFAFDRPGIATSTLKALTKNQTDLAVAIADLFAVVGDDHNQCPQAVLDMAGIDICGVPITNERSE